MSRTHAFVICAYKESPYLEFCMRSLRKQTVKSDIYLVTSTPSEYIDKLAETYRIPVFVRDGESSLKEDWLFGWRLAGADHSLVTIAHQDDKYHPNYTEALLKAYEQYPDMTVFCSDYVVMKTEEGVLSDGKSYPGTTRTVYFDTVVENLHIEHIYHLSGERHDGVDRIVVVFHHAAVAQCRRRYCRILFLPDGAFIDQRVVGMSGK